MRNFLCAIFALPLFANPLIDYSKNDAEFSWSLQESNDGVYCINLNSGNWRNFSEVDNPTWQHPLTLIVPDEIKSDEILLLITGRDCPMPDLLSYAKETNSLVANISNVPNQPLLFADDPLPRCEDALIAYGWDKFLRTGDPEWLPQLPMTRSVLRAMDALQEFCKEELQREVSGFVLTGRSKRGWASWTAAGIDKRVKAVIPQVIDLLNIKSSLNHHHCAYGTWSPALCDYVNMKIPERWHSPEFDKLISIIDPYELREQLKEIPKFIINSTGDAFFLPDSSQFYFNDLDGEKFLRYLPNTDHSLQGTNVSESIAAFYWAISNSKPLPKISWKLEKNELKISCDRKPCSVKLWSVTNPCARDFRLCKIGRAWRCGQLPGSKNFSASLSPPIQGWSAFFVELIFENEGPFPYTFTTDVFVLPDALPFDSQRVEEPIARLSPR